MLTERECITHLLDHGLLTARDIVEGDVAIVDVSRKNRNFKVIREQDVSFFLKYGIGPEGGASVAREAALYPRLQDPDDSGRMSWYTPRCYAYDAAEQLLITELLPAGEDLGAYHARLGRFPKWIARAAGDALGALHRMPVDWLESREPSEAAWPWALGVHRPGVEVFRHLSAGNLQLIQAIQSSREMCEHLDELRSSWQPTALVHNDVKWDNVIVSPRPARGRGRRLWLIDWELAGVGDPGWDAGSLFASYLSSWLFSIPMTGEDPPDRFMRLARYPLEKMQPALRTFWEAYTARIGPSPATVDERLLAAVRYAGVRLIQSAYEHLQSALALTGIVLCLLQLSLNIMRSPHEAAVHLLGIPLSPRPAEGEAAS